MIGSFNKGGDVGGGAVPPLEVVDVDVVVVLVVVLWSLLQKVEVVQERQRKGGEEPGETQEDTAKNSRIAFGVVVTRPPEAGQEVDPHTNQET